MDRTSQLAFVRPDWPAPAHVHAATTTRAGGHSRPPFDSFNLGARTDDDPRAVASNRALLQVALGLPEAPRWLRQVHGTTVLDANQATNLPAADASVSSSSSQVCVVLTADCVPVLLCDRAGTRVAAAHAGWRGLAGGILEASVSAMDAPPETLMAWLGPAIGPEVYEVDEPVRSAFVDVDAGSADAFIPTRPGHWTADLFALARRRLREVGVESVFGGTFCTHRDADRFFSHRRDGPSGRMATLIWRDG